MTKSNKGTIELKQNNILDRPQSLSRLLLTAIREQVDQMAISLPDIFSNFDFFIYFFLWIIDHLSPHLWVKQ